MLSTYYNVSIAAITGTANAAGFVDRHTVEQYMANNGGVAPTDLPTSTNKVRANIRYKNIVEQLQLMCNMYVSNTISNGATVDTPPTTFSFTLEAERGDDYVMTPDETTPGVTLYGANAVQRCVERGLIEFRANYVYPVYDPTASLPQGPANSSGLANAIDRVGSTTLTFNVDGLANSVGSVASYVTVNEIVF